MGHEVRSWGNIVITTSTLGGHCHEQGLPQPLPTNGTGSAKQWRPCTPAMAAGLTDHVWSLREVLLYRAPPWPQPVGVGTSRGVGSGTGREPEQTACVRTVGVEGVTRDQGATGMP